MSPKQLCLRLNLSPVTLQSLLDELDAIRAEVSRGTDAWMPVAVTPTISAVLVDTPRAGDVTIQGKDLDSWPPKVTTVRFIRPGVGTVTRNQDAILAAPPGAVTSTSIVVAASLLPAGGLKAEDSVQVRADGLDSTTFLVKGQ
jgi:hypothetical protein